MKIDWQAMKAKWIDDVKNTLLPKLSRDSRFINSIQLINRFHSELQVWERTAVFKSVIEIGNELASAEKLLDHLTANDSLTYEPPMTGTYKTRVFDKLGINNIADLILFCRMNNIIES